MNDTISATYIRPTKSLKHVMISYLSNEFSTEKTIAYVANGKRFDNYEKGQDFQMPANPRITHRFNENGDQYLYADGAPQLYLVW
tara:strand:+ start:318 stop:572 length:255 start_codon:yes stop_codon:yes gene_type:complete